MNESFIRLPQQDNIEYLGTNSSVLLNEQNQVVESARLQHFFYCQFGILHSPDTFHLYHLLPYRGINSYGSALYRDIAERMRSETNSWLLTFGKKYKEISDISQFFLSENIHDQHVLSTKWTHIPIDDTYSNFSIKSTLLSEDIETTLFFYYDEYASEVVTTRNFLISQQHGFVTEI